MSSEAILIVEDDPQVGNLLTRLVSKCCAVALAPSVHEARIAVATRNFVAVIVDAGLPDGTGFDVISEARIKDPGVHALIISGKVDGLRLHTAMSLNAHYILKPVDNDQVYLFVNRVLSKRRDLEERIDAYVAKWSHEYGLTPAEAATLTMCAKGSTRDEIAEHRDVSTNTLKKQVSMMLQKTGDSSLESLSNRLLRAVLEGR